MQQEVPLYGGNATARVVRVGETVRKPWTESSSGVLAYLQILRDRGVGVPIPMGRDREGRMVTEFVPGPLATASPPLTHARLRQVAALVRMIHDASHGLDEDELGLAPALIPVPNPDLVCHGDLAPWNLVVGDRLVFIDWDGAGASTRLWDLAYAAQTFTLDDASADPTVAAKALRAFVVGYGADAELRAALVEVIPRRVRAMYDLLETSHRPGRAPWGRMFTEGHGDHWQAVGRFVERYSGTWAEALG